MPTITIVLFYLTQSPTHFASTSQHGRACEKLLRHARADYDRTLVPGYRDLSYLLTYPTEVTGGENSNNETSVSITSKEQQRLLRQNRSQFTAAEDNLLLRGVVSTKY